MRPSRRWGQDWRKGGDHLLQQVFSRAIFPVFTTGSPVHPRLYRAPRHLPPTLLRHPDQQWDQVFPEFPAVRRERVFHGRGRGLKDPFVHKASPFQVLQGVRERFRADGAKLLFNSLNPFSPSFPGIAMIRSAHFFATTSSIPDKGQKPKPEDSGEPRFSLNSSPLPATLLKQFCQSFLG